MTEIALDLSSNDLGTIQPECWMEHGVTAVWLGVFDPIRPPQRMREVGRQCEDTGLQVTMTYGLPYFGSPYGKLRDIRWAVELAPEFGALDVMIDVETDGYKIPFSDASVPSVAQRISELWENVAVVEAAGLRPWIYTFRGYWANEMGNTTEFNKYPLVLADYGMNDATKPRITGAPGIGGWDKTTAHQYTSLWGAMAPYSEASPRCGRANRDANYFDPEDFGMGVSQKAFDDLMLAAFSGSEENGLSRAERLSLASYRIAQRVGEASDKSEANSLNSLISSAQAVSTGAATAAGLSALDITKLIDAELSKTKLVPGG